MDVLTMISRLGDYGFADESTATLLQAIQDAIWDIEGRSPWPWLEGVITLTFSGSSTSPSNMPTDFRAALNLVDNLTGAKIRWVRSDEYDDLIGNSDPAAFSGGVYMAYWDGTTINFYPQPSASQTVRMRYVKWSPAVVQGTLENAILLPPQFHRLILYGAVWRLYDMEDESDLAARYEQHFETGMQTMLDSMTRKQYMQADHIFITDIDDYYDA